MCWGHVCICLTKSVAAWRWPLSSSVALHPNSVAAWRWPLSSSMALHLYFFGDRLSYWTWSLPFWLVWITILLPDFLSCLPRVSGLQMGCRAFMWVLEIQMPQSSHLPSKPSPQATCLAFWYIFVIQSTKPCFRPSFFPLYCVTNFSLVGWDCNRSSELDVTQ